MLLVAGGSVQPAVCAPGAPFQEAVRGPLPGLRPQRQRRAGRLRGAGAVPDGGPDAGLRPVHISKLRTGKTNEQINKTGLSPAQVYLICLV